MAYWILTIGLIAFGVLGMLSIGRPFLLLGLAMLVLGPFRGRPALFWPPMAAVVAWNVGYMAVAPLYCTATEAVGTAGSGEGQSTTVCSSLIGATYSGHGHYEPPTGQANEAGLLPAAVTFVLVLGAIFLGRRSGLAQPPVGPRPAGSTRRFGILSATMVVAYAAFVALAPFALGNPGPVAPWWPMRPIAIFGLMTIPAVIAVIGAIRRVRVLFVVAGAICLLQAFVAFSGITFGFLIPAIVLLSLAGGKMRPTDEEVASPASVAAGVAALGLIFAAWVSLFSLTTPRCWTGVVAADGTITTIEVPATPQRLYGPALVPSGGSGCSSAEVTEQGIAVSAVLALGAVAVAGMAASRKRTTEAG
jgi:hypothetical protein